MFSLLWKISKRISAVDIGEHSAKFAVVDPDRRRVLGVFSKEIMPMRQGKNDIPHPIDLGKFVKEAVEACHETLPTFGIEVSASVQGEKCLGKYVEIPPLTPKELAIIMPGEAPKYIPFPAQDAVVTYYPVPVISGSSSRKGAVFLSAVHKDLVQNRAAQLEAAGLEAGKIRPVSVNLAKAFHANHRAPGHFCALIHAGFRWTHIVLVAGGHTYYATDIPLAGRDLTAAVQSAKGMEWSAAEKWLRAANVAEKGATFDPFFEQYLPEIKKVVNGFFAQFEPKPPRVKHYYLSGGMAAGRGLDMRFNEYFEVNATIERFDRIHNQDSRYPPLEDPRFQHVVGIGVGGG